MKFMFMIYHDENVLDAMPEKEMQALVDSAIEYAEEIRRSGHYIVSDALQRARTARTIRVRAGKVSTTDGPFAETKEQLGGFFVIEAKDMDEACAIAARFPPARIAVVERDFERAREAARAADHGGEGLTLIRFAALLAREIGGFTKPEGYDA